MPNLILLCDLLRFLQLQYLSNRLHIHDRLMAASRNKGKKKLRYCDIDNLFTRLWSLLYKH